MPTATSRPGPYLQLGLSDNVSYTYDPTAARGLAHHLDHRRTASRSTRPTTYRVGTLLVPAAGRRQLPRVRQRHRHQGLRADRPRRLDRSTWTRQPAGLAGLRPARGPGHRPADRRDGGETVAFDVSKLDLTSLGAPANTTLDAELIPADERLTDPGRIVRRHRRQRRMSTFAVPASVAAGDWKMVLTAEPSGTTVIFPLAVTADVGGHADASADFAGVRLAGPGHADRDGRPPSAPTPTGSVEFRSGDDVLATVRLVDRGRHATSCRRTHRPAATRSSRTTRCTAPHPPPTRSR